MSILNLFHLSYWFGTPNAITSQGVTFLLVIFGIMLLAGIALKSAAGKGKLERFVAKVVAKCGSMTLTMGFLGLIYVFLRYERVPWLSERFWLGLWFIGLLYWIYKIIHYHRKKVPKLRERHAENAKRYAFVPKRN